jgi:hypothetical protein
MRHLSVAVLLGLFVLTPRSSNAAGKSELNELKTKVRAVLKLATGLRAQRDPALQSRQIANFRQTIERAQLPDARINELGYARFLLGDALRSAALALKGVDGGLGVGRTDLERAELATLALAEALVKTKAKNLGLVETRTAKGTRDRVGTFITLSRAMTRQAEAQRDHILDAGKPRDPPKVMPPLHPLLRALPTAP